GDPGQRFGAAPVAARAVRPIDVQPLIALAPFGTSIAAPASATASADQSLVLRGILLAIPQSASSALISVGGAAPAAFYVGQQVGSGTIESIAADHLMLVGGGGRQMLGFPDRSGGAAAPTASGPSPSASMAIAVPVPGPTAPPAPPAGPSALLGSLGATIASDGLHITQATDRTRGAGLQPGDVIQRINGAPATDLMQNPTALQTLLADGNVQVVVSRGGQQVALSVPLK
ncbi:type II secretion system protein N, partial [Sphingomonas bacterium]|uniref:type II secretion system protein N n=1 Tax=Sphingomonas bacterium TaxID=1895847 RepID=UPI0015757E43